MSDRSETPSDNKIDLKSVKGILNMKFFVPDYQRGYRWTKQQVKELLNDIYEFHRKEGKSQGEFYCLQPLVVKKMTPDDKVNRLIGKKGINELTDEEKKLIEETWYEVIDGQQRLTTIFLLIKYLREVIISMKMKPSMGLYEIRYQRGGSGNQNYLDSIDFGIKEGENYYLNIENIDRSSIDRLYITDACHTIAEWFNNKETQGEPGEAAYNFRIVLLKEELDEKQQDRANNVRFVWYESEEKNSVEVFTRLNIGKISLTNAELIKALLLNSSNFEKDDHIKLRQREIANEWDQIEYTLQNEEFWQFIHNGDYKNPTRIDFIFDIICDKNEENYEGLGNDKHRTFRYFYEHFKKVGGREAIRKWDKVKEIFYVLEEWFNDLELYHYIGYLVSMGEGTEVGKLLDIWDLQDNKKQFLIKLKKMIWAVVMKGIKEEDSQGESKNPEDMIAEKLNKTYDDNKIGDAAPVLLLHNVLTVISQSKNSTEIYGGQVFYKFPFHIYKKEKWNVEHIDSNTPNDESETDVQKEWVLPFCELLENTEKKLKEDIIDFYNNKKPDHKKFGELRSKLVDKFHLEDTGTEGSPAKNEENRIMLNGDEKNQIMNFALLDEHTNKSYGNSIFSAKRRIVIGKDRGKKIKLISRIEGENLWDDNEDAESSFVPPCTKQVFLKYYSIVSTNPNYWTMANAKAYKKDISKTLEKLFKPEGRQDG